MNAPSRPQDIPIGFLNHTSQVSGAEISLLGLLEGLQRRTPDTTSAAPRYVPVLICPPGELAERARAIGVAVRLLPLPAFGYTWNPWRLFGTLCGVLLAAWRVARIVRHESFALLHANSVRAGLLACLGLGRHQVPVVCHVRDVLPSGLRSRLVLRGLRGAAALIAISHYVADSLADPVLQRKTRVIYNGVDVAGLQCQAAGGTTRATPGAGGPVLGVVGQLTPWKGQADAIRAFRLVVDECPTARLLITGAAKFTHASARYDTRRYARELHELVARLELADHVVFTGEQANIAAVLAGLDLLLVPSWEEPFGRVIIEALALGVPVIGTRAGGIGEILNGASDLLVPPHRPRTLAAGVLALLHDPARRAAIGVEGQARVRARFGLPRHVEAVTGLYRAVLHARQPLILYANHTGQISGAEISLLRLLERLDRARFRVLVACPGDSPLAARLAALAVPQVHWAPRPLGFTHEWRGALAGAWGVLIAAWELRRVIRQHRPALVHANSIRAAVLAAVAGAGAAPQLIAHVRDHLPAGWVSVGVRLLLHLRADLVLGVSRHTLARFRLPWRGVAPGRARYAVLHDGVDPTRFDPVRAAGQAACVRRELGLAGAYPVLGVVGQLTPWKGQDDAIRALHGILPAYPAARLLIVGEAKFTNPTARYDTRRYQDHLLALVADLGLADHVIFTGERADTPAVMGLFDVLLLPSWSEPFGLVGVEAMALGKAVIATGLGGPADVIRPGQDGYLVRPQHPEDITATLLALLADETTRHALGANARRRVTRAFTVDHQARRAARLYGALLHPHRRRGECCDEYRTGA